MFELGDTYVISQVAMFTGLTDRTIRNYLSMGVLEGEKINGIWHFTPEQVENFVSHPAVRPSILAKNNSLIYDFLAEDKKKQREICLVLDIPDVDRMSVATFFSKNITEGEYHNIRFNFDGVKDMGRVILRGDATEVLRLVNEFQAR